VKALINSQRGGLWLPLLSIAGIAVFVTAIAVLMAPYQPVIGDRLPEMQCLQVAFTPERAEAVINSFNPEEQRAIAGLLIPGDLGLAWGYGLFLAGLIGLLARQLDEPWRSRGAVAMWFPIAASVFDCIEDVFLHGMVTQMIASPGGELSAVMPLLASIAATIKYTALSVLTPAFAVTGIVQGIRTNRRAAAWFVYVLVLAGTLMFALPPLSSLPACF